MKEHPPTNYVRRTLGVAVCLMPVWLLIASTVMMYRVYSGWSMVVLIPALLVSLWHMHLSFTRPYAYFRRHGSMEGFQFVSGIPMLGTVLIVFGLAIGFGAIISTAIAAIAMGVDTCGSIWFLIATWRDRSLWDC